MRHCSPYGLPLTCLAEKPARDNEGGSGRSSPAKCAVGWRQTSISPGPARGRAGHSLPSGPLQPPGAGIGKVPQEVGMRGAPGSRPPAAPTTCTSPHLEGHGSVPCGPRASPRSGCPGSPGHGEGETGRSRGGRREEAPEVPQLQGGICPAESPASRSGRGDWQREGGSGGRPRRLGACWPSLASPPPACRLAI